ncbi:hypothetical protein ISF_09215 [Cordyceps fumosorosea ARSEF 2679]|uniref:Heat-labile enterotoxin, A chain n=1 Tax=Cordyceps fumosorosea (strain ARSEF 2679) TaxID=1081104 RepID=A0A167LCU8_CORFA|nr:hypothetical protein ISF_09215 [Cordyceps fumosorosea ARSEF 2679]OAA52937.1 hypothetical protein ISF_09215 [Cordyceps fumosorosea ARSEF 2679]
MLILKRALLFGLAAANLVASRAHGHVPSDGYISRRGLAEPTGNDRIPDGIQLGNDKWTRQEIVDAIAPGKSSKPFGNNGLEFKGGRWQPKTGGLFEVGKSKLLEYDLTKSTSRGKYRAITTSNRNFIGITEHVENNNVRAFYDVKQKVSDGFYLTDPPMPDIVTGTNGARFARKDIAAAMVSQTKTKTSNGKWRSKITALGGADAGAYNVVYDGNRFVYIEDGSDIDAPIAQRKLYPAPKCKRDGTGDCILGEEEEETGLNNTKEDGKTTEPTEEEGKTAEPAEEEGKLTEHTTPLEEGATPIESAESVKIAEEISQREFAELAARGGMSKSIKDAFSLSIQDARSKLLGYKPLTLESSRFELAAGKLANLPFERIAVGSYINGVTEAFEKDVNIFDKAKAVTSIVPIIGCTANAVSEAFKDNFDMLDTVLCGLGDGLMLSPAAPIGLAIHAIRGIIKAFDPPPVPKQEDLLKTRDDQWNKFLADYVYAYIYSKVNDNSTSKEQPFRTKLGGTLAMHGLAVVSEGAKNIGVANAVAQKSLGASKDGGDKAGIEQTLSKATEGIRAGVWNETLRQQRNHLLALPDMLRDGAAASLKSMADNLNKEYVDRLKSPEMAEHYKKVTPVPGVSGTESNNLAEVREKLQKIATYLQSKPPVLPPSFNLAYMLGQSKGLQGLDPAVLSPRDYLRELPGSNLSEDRINFFVVFHALEVAMLLRGELKRTEDELRNPWKSDIKDARPLQLLIAIKFGHLYEEEQKQGAAHPDIPPLVKQNDLGSVEWLAKITGLSEEEVEKVPKGGESLSYLKLVTDEKMVLAMQDLLRGRAGGKASKP